MGGISSWQKALVAVLAIVGVAAIAVAIVYFVTPANSLPSFFPASSAHAHATKHGVKHGAAALGLGVVLLVIAGGLLAWFRTRIASY